MMSDCVQDWFYNSWKESWSKRSQHQSYHNIGDSKVVSSESIKNIGTMLDKHLKLDKQVNLTYKNAWFNIYLIGKIKRYLSKITCGMPQTNHI